MANKFTRGKAIFSDVTTRAIEAVSATLSGALTAASAAITGNVSAATFNSLPRGESTAIQSADVTIATAAVKTLFGTPVTLVAAPGANKALLFEGAVVFMDYGTVAYDGIAAGEDISIKYENASGLEVGQCETTGFLDQATDQVRIIRPHHAASGNNAITPLVNKPLVMQILIDNIATGDSPIKVRTFYRVVPTVL